MEKNPDEEQESPPDSPWWAGECAVDKGGEREKGRGTGSRRRKSHTSFSLVGLFGTKEGEKGREKGRDKDLTMASTSSLVRPVTPVTSSLPLLDLPSSPPKSPPSPHTSSPSLASLAHLVSPRHIQSISPQSGYSSMSPSPSPIPSPRASSPLSLSHTLSLSPRSLVPTTMMTGKEKKGRGRGDDLMKEWEEGVVGVLDRFQEEVFRKMEKWAGEQKKTHKKFYQFVFFFFPHGNFAPLPFLFPHLSFSL